MSDSLMLINQTDDECRIAIVVDGLLQEMLIEHTTSSQIKNNIYRGTIVQVQTSLQAAFVDYGEKKHGFLPNSELNPSLYLKKGLSKSKPIQQKVKVGQEIIVQVTREAVDHKGSALTTNITLPGRFMVLMPNNEKGGISKKIESQKERDRLKGFLSGIEAEEHAVIIRTAGIGRKLSELKKDYTTLKKNWNNIKDKFKKLNHPGLILEEDNVVIRTLRDYYTEDIKEVWVDNPETFQKSLQFFKQVAPRKQKDLKLFVGDRSLFATYNIERQVEQLTSNNVKLKSGGSIVINQTEALVAIDVNSGKSNQEENIDSTALRTNLEAANEVARQLRLRNLGGLIVIDFIDMENESFRKKVEEQLSNAMQTDKAQLRFNPISQFGLLEMSRQRLAISIANTIESTCPTCNGKGKIPSLLASTNLIIRSIREIAAKGNIKQIVGELPLELVNHLLNERRQSIYDLEMEFGIDIVLRGDPNILVFQEKLVKPVFDQKSPQPPSRKESPKAEPKNKRDRKPSQQKEIPAKKQRKDKIEQADPELEKSTAEQPQETIEEKPKTATKAKKAQKKTKEKNLDNDAVPSYGIHPSALFSDIQELGKEELEEITESFGNRLKGKADNNASQFIDDKYLWKTVNGKNEDGSTSKIEGNQEDTEADESSKESEETDLKVTQTSKKKESKKGKSRKPVKKAKKKTTDTKKTQKKDEEIIESDPVAEKKGKKRAFESKKETKAKSAPKKKKSNEKEPRKTGKVKSEDKKEPKKKTSPATKKKTTAETNTSKRSSTSTKSKTVKKAAVKTSSANSKKQPADSAKKSTKSKDSTVKKAPKTKAKPAKKVSGTKATTNKKAKD